MNMKSLLYQSLSRKDLLDWEKTKRGWAKTMGRMVKSSEILTAYRQLVREKKVKPSLKLENSLKIRKVRTLSGVAPFAIMMKPYPCPGQCIYCPLENGMPKSYLSDEPAAARAKKLNFDPKKQFIVRMAQLKKIGHQPEKLQIIVIGGTFSAYPLAYKKSFLKAIYYTANLKTSKTIEQAQKLNQKVKQRIVGLSIETRPELITDREIKLLRKYGVTKVQMGVQTLDKAILKKIKRGHTINHLVKTTQKLKDAGFKINYHIMPNLPGSTPEKDLKTGKDIFADPRFRPDTLKIYPCVVIPNSELYQLWKQGQYQPYDDRALIGLLVRIKKIVPPYCRIDRLIRDIPRQWTAAGTKLTNLRQIVKRKMEEQGRTCQCIRCREVRDLSILNKKVSLKIRRYRASGGEELFLSFEDKNYLYGLLRLRLPSKDNQVKPLFPALKNAAIIRELQVFGEQVPISKKVKNASQHQSLGKKLVKKAEELSQKAGYHQLAIISGAGVRGYYQRLGYKLVNTYMLKSL